MRKGSLREFQEALSRRLAVAASRSSVQSRLAIESAGVVWLSDLPDVGEVLRVPVLTPVPMARPCYAGLANVRGSLYSVIDFAMLCGSGATPRGATARLLLCARRLGMNAALLVERVRGLRNAEGLHLQEASPNAHMLPAAAFDWAGEAYTDTEGTSCRELCMEKLVRHPDFINVAVT